MRLLVVDKISAENTQLIARADKVIDFTGQAVADSKMIECSDEYNNLRCEIKEKYIKYIASLGEENITGCKIKEIFHLEKNCSLWWFSEIFHKDTFNDPFFDDLCKAILIKRIKERIGADEIVLSCPDGSLLQSVFAGTNEHPFSFILKAMVSRLRLMVNYLRIKMQLQNKKIIDSAPSGTLFFSYYPNNWNKDSKGVFSDRIFRDLPSKIKDYGYILCLGVVDADLAKIDKAAYIQNNLSYRELILRFFDIRNAIKYLYFRNKISKLFFFEGIDIRSIYDRYMWYSVVMNDYYDAIIATGVANIAKKIAPKQIISAGEFGAIARAVVVGAKKYNIPVTWLQHAVISRSKLWYFNSIEEIVDQKGEINSDHIHHTPVADQFLVWGNKSIDALREYGYPLNRLRVVGNPRYDEFLNVTPGEIGEKNAIVFTPTINCKEINTFARLAIGVKAKSPEKKVVVKLHPRYKDIVSECEMELEAIRLAGVTISTDPIERFFHRSNIFICGVSTTAIEAAYYGLRVMTFVSKYNDRFTPDWTDGDNIIYSLEELLEKLEVTDNDQFLPWEFYYQTPGGATAAVLAELNKLSVEVTN